MKTPYDVLDVSRNAAAETIRLAFRKAAKAHHPDLNAGDPTAGQQMRLIIAAYNMLKDPEERAAYDREQAAYDQHLRSRRRTELRKFASAVVAGLVGGSIAALIIIWPPAGAIAERAQQRLVRSGALPVAEEAKQAIKDAGGEIREAKEPKEAKQAKEDRAVVSDNDDDAAGASTSKDPAFYLARGELRSRRGDLDRAIADFDEAIRLGPDKAPAYSHRGNAWRSKGDKDRALADYEAAIRIDPNNPVVFRDRGILWRELGDLDQALIDLDCAIRLGFSDASAYNERGLVWYEKKHYERAIADFNQALKVDPSLVSALVNRSIAWRSKGDLDRATADFDQAIRLDPALAAAHYNRDQAWAEKRASAQGL